MIVSAKISSCQWKKNLSTTRRCLINYGSISTSFAHFSEPSLNVFFFFFKKKEKSMNNATLSDRGGGGGIGLLLLNGPCFLFCDSRTRTQNKTYRVLYLVMDLCLFFTSYFWTVLLISLVNTTILAPHKVQFVLRTNEIGNKNWYDYI